MLFPPENCQLLYFGGSASFAVLKVYAWVLVSEICPGGMAEGGDSGPMPHLRSTPSLNSLQTVDTGGKGPPCRAPGNGACFTSRFPHHREGVSCTHSAFRRKDDKLCFSPHFLVASISFSHHSHGWGRGKSFFFFLTKKCEIFPGS